MKIRPIPLFSCGEIISFAALLVAFAFLAGCIGYAAADEASPPEGSAVEEVVEALRDAPRFVDLPETPPQDCLLYEGVEVHVDVDLLGTDFVVVCRDGRLVAEAE